MKEVVLAKLGTEEQLEKEAAREGGLPHGSQVTPSYKNSYVSSGRTGYRRARPL